MIATSRWFDKRGSSFVYAIGDRTTDGLDRNMEKAADGVPENYRDYLRSHPGSIDMWLHGHTHRKIAPGTQFNGRKLIQEVDGVTFVNVGALTRYHFAPEVPFSRMLHFTQGSDMAKLTPFLHAEGWAERPIGLAQDLARTCKLRHSYQP